MARQKVQIPKTFITESWQLLKNNKVLYFLPLINLIATSILLFLFFSTLVSRMFMQDISHASDAVMVFLPKIILMVISLVLIPLIGNLINATVIFYCDAKIKNQSITITSALVTALKRAHDLIFWSLIQGTVGFLLSLIDNTHQGVSELVIDMFFGVAWGLISFFVMPIMLLENKGAFESIKVSSQTIKHLWNKRAVLRLGLFGLVMFLLFVLGAAIVALGFYAHDQWSFYIVAVGILFLIALAYTNRLLSMIIRMRLYMAIKAGEYQA